MKVHLIKEKTIRNFILQHADSKLSFEDWLLKIRFCDWAIAGDIKFTFPTADLLGRSSFRVIFNVAGNKYRMICKYGFGESEVHLFICWIGSHAFYDKLCSEQKQYAVNDY